MNYGNKKEIEAPFVDVVERVKAELAREGFGIITEIDVQKTLREKIGVEYGNYIILGACNPAFAYEALKAENDIGLRLPCNVVVREENGKTVVVAVSSEAVMGSFGNHALNELGKAAEEKLKRALDCI